MNSGLQISSWPLGGSKETPPSCSLTPSMVGLVSPAPSIHIIQLDEPQDVIDRLAPASSRPPSSRSRLGFVLYND